MSSRRAAKIRASKQAFFQRLRDLGFTSYDDYLGSDHWRQFRVEYFGSARPKRCVVCGGEDGIQLHHVTYKRLGEERLSDVVPVCRDHHSAIHRRVKSPIGEATVSVARRFEREERQSAAQARNAEIEAQRQARAEKSRQRPRRPTPTVDPKMVRKYGGYLAKQSAKNRI